MQAHPVFDADGNVIQAINVFRDVTADREADERRRFLLQAVDELNSSLDYETTLAAIARLAVPVLADWCGVDVVEDGRVKRLATAHVDPNKLAAAIAIEKRYPPDPRSKTGVQEIVRTGEAQLIPEIPRQLLTAAAVDEEHLRLIDELELRSFMGVPLTIGGRVLGAITLRDGRIAPDLRTGRPRVRPRARRSRRDRGRERPPVPRGRERPGVNRRAAARGGAAPARGRGSDAVRGDVRGDARA